MFVASSTLDEAYHLAKAGRKPGCLALRQVLWAASVLDRDAWLRRCDFALIGGDPVVLSLRLLAIMRTADFRCPPKIALLHDGRFSGAPLALLGSGVIPDMEGLGLRPEGPEMADIRRAVFDLVDRAVETVGTMGGQGVLARENLQGSWDRVRREGVLRLAGPRAARNWSCSPPDQQLCPAEKGLAGEIFEKSRTVSEEGIRRLFSGLGRIFETPPRRPGFAHLVTAPAVEVYSGFISVGPPEKIDMSSEAMDRIGASISNLARSVPLSLEETIDLWRKDLAEAGRVSSGNT